MGEVVEPWADGVYREDEILGALDHCDESQVFDWMSRTLPFKGSKVDWDGATGEHSHWFVGEDEARLEGAVSEISELLGDQGDVIHAGDGLSNFAVRFPASDRRRVISSLLALPEHHYFLAADESWFVAFSFEGDVDLLRF
jgi:hypothetical protein